MRKFMRGCMAILTFPLLIGMFLVMPSTAMAAPPPAFPAAHQSFLGGASYAALFGHDTSTFSSMASALGLGASTKSPLEHDRPARVGPNVQVNAPQVPAPNGLIGRSETSIATTHDGKLLVAGWNDARGFLRPPFGNTLPGVPGLSGYGFSSDGGQTWTDAGAPAVFNHIVSRGDPWLSVGGDDNKTFFYANLAVDDRLPAGQTTLGVSVHRGAFSGKNFAWNDVHLLQAPNYPNDFYDKESITVGGEDGQTGYVTLTNFKQVCGAPGAGFGQIEVWRTHDGGNTWQGPVVAGPDLTTITDPTNPKCGASGILQQSSSAAIGPHGEVYVSWSVGPGLGFGEPTDGDFAATTGSSAPVPTAAAIAVATSLDGGKTFGVPVIVANINTMRQDVPVGYSRNRFNDHPRIAAITDGKHKGRVDVVFYSPVAPVGPAPVITCPAGTAAGTTCIGQNLVSSQVFSVFSDNKGVTWSTPKALAPPVPATGVKRFWPVVTVKPGGNIGVVYQESQEMPTAANPVCNRSVGGGVRRVGAANSLVNTFLVESEDGGAEFNAPVRVSSATSNWCTAVSNITPNFGDYIGSASDDNQTFALWADGRNNEPDVFYATVKGSKG